MAVQFYLFNPETEKHSDLMLDVCNSNFDMMVAPVLGTTEKMGEMKGEEMVVALMQNDNPPFHPSLNQQFTGYMATLMTMAKCAEFSKCLVVWS